MVLYVLQLVYCSGGFLGARKIILKFIAELVIKIASFIKFKNRKGYNIFILVFFFNSEMIKILVYMTDVYVVDIKLY